jgi:hypothetical protein
LFWLLLAASIAWFSLAGPASALQVGPVSVNIPVPTPVTITVPKTVKLGPVVVTAPDLPTASVTVSPDTGIAVGATIPPTLGPVPLLPHGPHSVQVTIGPGGAGVTTPAAPGPAAPGATAPGPTAPGSDVTPAHPAVPAVPPGVGLPMPTPAIGTPAALSATSGSAARTSSAPGSSSSPSAARTPSASPSTVNASLQRPVPEGTWTLVRDVVTGHVALWLALLAILAVARWALVGLVRDARKRALAVSSS